MTKQYLSRDVILAVQDVQAEDVEVPEWGGVVRVQGLTGAQRDAYEASMVEGKGKNRTLNLKNIRAKLVALTVVDERGKPLFTDADVQALGRKSGAALDRIFNVAQRLSGLSKEDIDEFAGNSEPGQSDGSTSD